MKKIEAEELAVKKVDVIIEYITQILSDKNKVDSVINFSTAKIEGNNMSTIDIYVPVKDFERHINLGITSDHLNVIYKEFLDRIPNTFFTHDTIGVSRFYSMRTSQEQFDGIDAINIVGSKIKINMSNIDKEISDKYNKKYDEFVMNLNSHKTL